jgi:flagellar protein FliS
MRNAATTTPYRRTQILTANPSELMLLLYNAAMCFGEQAIAKMEQNQYDESHALIVKVESIVLELSSGLRRDVYPELVDNLSRLFEFVFYRLFEANVSQNPACIRDAIKVLGDLRDSWVAGIDLAARSALGQQSDQPVTSVELSA